MFHNRNKILYIFMASFIHILCLPSEIFSIKVGFVAFSLSLGMNVLILN